MPNLDKIIFLIRHGETEYNKLGVVQGSGIDADLNDTGRKQAKAFFEMYKNVPFQKIYISKLKRTFQTIESFIENGIPHEELIGLNEISWGEKEGKVPNSIEDALYADLLSTWAKGDTHIAPEGGESPEDVVLRQKISLDVILGNTEESLILVAMHGRAMRILLTHIMHLPLKQMDDFEHSNTCLYKLKYSYQNKSFEILAANDIQHLITADESILA
jgi:broad specificity phosphatase PhoE